MRELVLQLVCEIRCHQVCLNKNDGSQTCASTCIKYLVLALKHNLTYTFWFMSCV